MSVLVEQQDEQLNVIETTAAAVEKDTEVGSVDGPPNFSSYDHLRDAALAPSQTWVHRESRRVRPVSEEEALDLLHHLSHRRHHYRRRHHHCRQEQVDAQVRLRAMRTCSLCVWSIYPTISPPLVIPLGLQLVVHLRTHTNTPLVSSLRRA